MVPARIETQDDAGLSDITANTKRLCLGLEWSWQRPQVDGGRMVPELELGIRYDGGDGREGFDLELGGGISR